MIADRVIFACIIVVAAVYFYATAQIPTLDIGDPLGPKAFPRLLGVCLLGTAALLLFEMIKDAAQRAGIDKNGTPHRLRASVATILLDAGMPLDQVQKFLRHKRITTTQIYAETSLHGMGENYVRALGGKR